MNIAINVENLSKRYLITDGSLGAASRAGLAGNIFRRRSRNASSEFWAVRDLSFSIPKGQRVGIVGRNGAGKSTLLKMLSRITAPTTGTVRVRGNLSSLLEVGTGFHPELTGRENIFLNGAILGIPLAEIRKKFDEIVEFSGVEKFLDTPVKRYSSGMYVRLAFAVAAHLEPENLIVDEVLAVGDAQFQKKCLSKLREQGQNGRTVLFVSHNMHAVRQLCDRAIFLSEGRIVLDGDPDSVIERYLQEIPKASNLSDIPEMIKKLPRDEIFDLLNVKISQAGVERTDFINDQPIDLEITYKVNRRVEGLRINVDICDTDGSILFRSFQDGEAEEIPSIQPGTYVSKATIPPDLLGTFGYEIHICAGIFNVRACMPCNLIIPILVRPSPNFNRAYVGDVLRGKLAPRLSWTTKEA